MSVWLPINELAQQVNSGKISAVENVEKSFKLIEGNAEYKAIITTTKARAIERAKQIDAKPSGRLAGVPFIAKDNFLVFGADTTAASNILKGFEAPYQSTAVDKLESEGAICVAKANLDAFAHGASTENSDFFTTLNPIDSTRVPGGSSGGSAAAIALDLAPFALGTDTGGSIRQPSSFCGVVGLKPTYGLVSRSGVVAMGSSLDCIGPITHSVDDAALILDVMSGKDHLDATTIDRDKISYTSIDESLRGAKVGVIREHFGEGADPNVIRVLESAIAKIEKAGAQITELSLPSLPLALAVYYILCPAEVSSNLARYDGQRFGYSYQEATNLYDSYAYSRGYGFGKEAKRRIMIGTYVLSSGYYDAYYKRAQIVRTKIINEFADAFTTVDFLLGPVAPTTAFKIGQNIHDPMAMYLADVMTVGANLAGVPAISIPAGLSDGLPVGLQIIAPQHRDRQLLGIAKSTESVLA